MHACLIVCLLAYFAWVSMCVIEEKVFFSSFLKYIIHIFIYRCGEPGYSIAYHHHQQYQRDSQASLGDILKDGGSSIDPVCYWYGCMVCS